MPAPAKGKSAAARGKTGAPTGQRNLLLPVEGGRAKTPRIAPAKASPKAEPAEETPKRRRKAS
jgi:hypothetical protein